MDRWRLREKVIGEGVFFVIGGKEREVGGGLVVFFFGEGGRLFVCLL